MDPGFGVRFRRARLPAALGVVLASAAFACGRRGPPLPPVRVTPEEPRLLPLQQEGREIVMRWVAPARAAGGDDAELRLRRAVVLHRVVDLQRRIGEARAAGRAETARADGEPGPPEGEDAPAEDLTEDEAPAAGPSTAGADEAPVLPGEPGDPSPPDEQAPPGPDPAQPAAATTPGGEGAEDAPPSEGAAPVASEPGAAASEAAERGVEQPAETSEEQPAESGGERTAGRRPPAESGAQPPAGTGEERPAETGGEQPAEASEERPAEPGGEQPTEPRVEPPAQPGGEQLAEPVGEGPDEMPETGSEEPVDELSEEPEAPTGVVVQYDDEGEGLEVLTEVESEVPGEERTLRLPVPPDWVGRRLVVALRYESRSEPSGESERREIDVAEPLPDTGPVTTTVEAAGVALAWPDVRPEAAAAAPLSNPLFEVVRRRGTDSAQAARIPVPRWTDGSVVWGEEVCYSVRLVVVGDDEPRTVEDPGPEFDPAPPDSPDAETDSAAAAPGADAPTEGEPGSDPPGGGGLEAPGDEGGGAAGEGADEAETAAPEAGEDPPASAEPAGAEAEAGAEGADALPGGTPGGAPGTEADPSWQPVPVLVPPTGSRTMSVGTRSREVCLVPEDTFAPPAPTDVRAFWRPEATELNWRAADAPDVRGYAVYRSEAEGSGYERLTPAPVAAASFSDRDRDPETRYFYAVTALDTADPPNESPRSSPVPVRPRSR